jgi:hypothetical protein
LHYGNKGITKTGQWIHRGAYIDTRILARVETARAMGMHALIEPRRFGDSFVA